MKTTRLGKIFPIVFAFVLGFAVGILLSTPPTPFPKTSPHKELYQAVLCPERWTIQIAQRYDDRNKRGEITKSTWIRKCQ